MLSTNTAMLVVMCVFLVFIKDCDGNGVRRGFNFVLHTTAMTWNEALAVCEGSGQTLFSPASLQKSTDFQQIYNLWTGDGETLLELWMGMYDTNPPTMNFIWTDCCVTGTWSSWGMFEPNMGDTEHCVRLYAGTKWKTRSCDVAFAFICETQLDGCVFETLSDTSLVTSNDMELMDSVSQEDCKNYCLYLLTNMGEECIAFTFTLPNPCWIQKGTQLYVTTLPHTNINLNSTTGFKKCYTYSINRTSSASPDPTSTPKHICSVNKICGDPLFLPSSSKASTIGSVTSNQEMYSTSVETSGIWSVPVVTDSSFSYPPSSQNEDIDVSTPSQAAVSYGSSDMLYPSSVHTSESAAIGENVKSLTSVSTNMPIPTAVPNENWIARDTSVSDILYPSSVYISESAAIDHSLKTLTSASAGMPISTAVPNEGRLTTDSSVPYSSEVPHYVTTPDMCPCLCYFKGNVSELYKMLLNQLRVNRRELSRFRRSRTSADDPRLSARAMGSVLGVGVLVSVALFVIILDLNVIIKLFCTSKHR